MKVASSNGCKVYNLSSGKSFPLWLSEAKRRILAKDEEYRRRLELIQDFEMNTAAQCIKITPDGEHIVVTGTYPPCVRVYTVHDLALKFHRGLTCEVIAMETLSDGYEKLVFLQADRTINFHAPYGTHYSIRVPKFGRCMTYDWNSCDLFIGSVGDEIYRLNLEIGQFREPYKLSYGGGCNKIHINPTHSLIACGGEGARCEFYDMRYRKSVSSLQIDTNSPIEVTALKFDTDGLTLGVGTSNGKCILYDIRSRHPLFTKDHLYGEKMVDVAFHHSSRSVISTDKKVIKIWDRDESNRGRIMTNIETTADVNDIAYVNDQRGETGMIMIAGEQSKIMSYFIPQLGPAPRWCSFLEALTEELEESSNQAVYEDYKFLTTAEVEELGASGLIGTPMLKSYMHGFFMDMKLYTKLRAVSKPFEYEEHRRKAIQSKIDAKRESRITPRKRNKVTGYSSRGGDDDDDSGNEDSHQSRTVAINGKVILDPRFAGLSREEFKVDENSEAFRLRHPVKASNQELGLRRRQLDDSDNEEDKEEDKEEDGKSSNRNGNMGGRSKIVTIISKNRKKNSLKESDQTEGYKRYDEKDDYFDKVDINESDVEDDDEDEQILKSSQRSKTIQSKRIDGSKNKNFNQKKMKSQRKMPQMFEA